MRWEKKYEIDGYLDHLCGCELGGDRSPTAYTNDFLMLMMADICSNRYGIMCLRDACTRWPEIAEHVNEHELYVKPLKQSQARHEAIVTAPGVSGFPLALLNVIFELQDDDSEDHEQILRMDDMHSARCELRATIDSFKATNVPRPKRAMVCYETDEDGEWPPEFEAPSGCKVSHLHEGTANALDATCTHTVAQVYARTI